MNAVEYIKRYWWYYAALILILLFALYYRAGPAGQPGAISNFVIPTWGNTMYHVGIERETINTGFYPQQELSYGGGFPNFYVPAYRLLVVALSTATGIDPMPMSGLVVLLLGAFCLLALYIVAFRLSGGNYWVALFAAFFFLMSPDMTINTERPFPELMGLFILPVALYFVLREGLAAGDADVSHHGADPPAVCAGAGSDHGPLFGLPVALRRRHHEKI